VATIAVAYSVYQVAAQSYQVVVFSGRIEINGRERVALCDPGRIDTRRSGEVTSSPVTSMTPDAASGNVIFSNWRLNICTRLLRLGRLYKGSSQMNLRRIKGIVLWPCAILVPYGR
jgi:hypothetical protein